MSLLLALTGTSATAAYRGILLALPYRFTWLEWCASFVQIAGTEYSMQAPIEDWVAWAAELLNNADFVSLGVPQPYAFATWQAWAVETVQALA